MDTDLPNELQKMIDHLEKLYIESRSGVARKEVAAWSAAVLYITILIALLNLFSKAFVEKDFWWTLVLPILAVILLFLSFLLFIWREFGSINYRTAMGAVAGRWMFKLLKKREMPENHDMQEGSNIPGFLLADIDEENKKLRRHPLWRRFFVPLMLLRKETRRQRATEIEEAIIYDILLVITACVAGLIFYFYLLASRSPQ